MRQTFWPFWGDNWDNIPGWTWTQAPLDFTLEQPGGWRHTVLTGSLTGTNNCPQKDGTLLVDRGRDFAFQNVVVGCLITNTTKKRTGIITAVSGDQLTVSDVTFDQGDFYIIWLNTAWTLQNEDMPVIEVECNLCGFRYKRSDLVKGLCRYCQDKEVK